MNPQVSELIKSYFLLALYLAPFLLVSWLFIRYIGKRNIRNIRNEANYEKRYVKIQSFIHEWPVDEKHYCVLLKCLDRLQQLPYKNWEKTDVLKCEFKKRYGIISDEILSEHEFSPEAVFRN